jgi:thiamine-phosphate pyrophosphorylase
MRSFDAVKWTLPPIYPITDKRISGKPSHLAIVRELIRGGATIIQIRDKETPVRDLLTDIRRCVELAARSEVQIMVNDRCDLALLGGAAGVHLGQDDLPPEDARRALGPEAIIGWSIHSLGHLRRAAGGPAQYFGFGPVFDTATKPDHAPATGLRLLRTVCRESSKPIVAIGGIGPDRIQAVFDAGAASAAIISALMTARNLAHRMEQLLKLAGTAASSRP